MPRGRPKKATKPGRKPGKKPVAKKSERPAAVVVRKSGIQIDQQSRALFLEHHLPEITKFRDQARSAQNKLRSAYKSAKADGFLKCDFDTAFRLKEQMGEQEIKARMAREMMVARFLGCAIGKQLDLFLDTDKPDIETQDDPKAPGPVYSPGANGKAGSGIAITRSQFKAQQAVAKRQADAAEERSLFTKRQPPPDDEVA